MAFVILSRRHLTRSKTHTISLEFFGSLMVLALLAVLGLGLFIGSRMHRSVDFSEAAPAFASSVPQESQASPDSSSDLVERIGELSARMRFSRICLHDEKKMPKIRHRKMVRGLFERELCRDKNKNAALATPHRKKNLCFFEYFCFCACMSV